MPAVKLRVMSCELRIVQQSPISKDSCHAGVGGNSETSAIKLTREYKKNGIY